LKSDIRASLSGFTCIGGKMEDKVLLEEMSWLEIEHAVKDGKTTVIVVSGAIEQHGPHLPTGTDTILGYEVAQRAARQFGKALVAPVIRPCLSEHHMGFPGSLTLSWQTYNEVLYDYCESLANFDFTDIILTSSHGGNNAVLTAITPDIARKLYTKVNIHLIDYLALCFEEETAYLKGLGISRGKAGVHAGYGETAQMLIAQPDLVKMESAERGLDDESFYEPQNISRSQIDSFIYGIKHFSQNGILGDPRGADSQAGEKLLGMAARAFAKAISNRIET
jgi:creatinine amidohydrolase